jgi:hypothetical protein
MVVLPGARPFTTPEEPIVATKVLLLVQVPPGRLLPSVILLPAHSAKKVELEVIAPGDELTVTGWFALQPVAVTE